MVGSAAYWLGANRSLTSSGSSLDILRLPDESLDGSPRRSILDTFDFLDIVEQAVEGDRESEMDFSIKIVDTGRSSLVDLAEGKCVCRRWIVFQKARRGWHVKVN